MTTTDAASRRPQTLDRGAPVVAFDVGGTDIKAALFDGSGSMLGLNRSPTPRDETSPAEVIGARLAVIAGELMDAFPDVHPVAAGLAAPGIVDEAAGVGVYSSNLGWRDAPVRAIAQSALQLPVAFIHDVRAAGTVEHRLGAARPFSDAVVIVIGTGVSATLIIDGRVHLGGGYAGEIGHACVDPQGELCPCGARGCLETVAAGGAIVRRYTARTGRTITGTREVVARAAAGDPDAAAVWDAAATALAAAIAHLVATLAPQAVVLGGGLAEAGDTLLEPVRRQVDALLSFHRRPLLLRAEVGENAGLLGAALLARDLAAQMSGIAVTAMPS